MMMMVMVMMMMVEMIKMAHMHVVDGLLFDDALGHSALHLDVALLDAVHLVDAELDHLLHTVVDVEDDEAEPARSIGDVVDHHHRVRHGAVRAEVVAQIDVRGVRRQTTHENLLRTL